MNRRNIWLIAVSAGLTGAAGAHCAWLLREPPPAPRAVARVQCEPGDEPLGNRERGLEALRELPVKPASVERAPTESPAEAAPSARAMFARWGLPAMPLPTPEQRELMLRHRYGALFRELALSPVETERMLHVLSEQEARSLRGSGSPLDREDASSRASMEAAAAIGADKAAAFDRLRGTMSARYELRGIRDQLEDAGEPMTGDQYRALLTAISSRGLDLPAAPPRGDTPEDSAELFRDWMSERDDAFREAAATILNPAQLNFLDERRELREALQSPLGTAVGSAKAPAASGG